jgi:homoserine kinase type II
VDGVSRLLEAWRLEGVVAVSEVPEGATHRVYRVACVDRVVYLRVYKRFDRAMARREHALIRHVRDRGLPAPLPVVACGGESVVERDGRLAALYEAARGVQIAPGSARLQHASAAGEALARLHQATVGLPDVGYTPRTLGWDGAAWVERLNVVERAIRARGDDSPGDAWALRRVAAQREWLRDAACAHSAVPRFLPQVVHGDYHDANLFFEGDRVSGIIDWEQAAFLPRAYEVVRACFFMFRLAPLLSQAFLLAYRSVSELSDAELGDGAASWGCNADHHVWPLEEVYLHGNERARRFIPHAPFVPFAQAWRGVVGESGA